MPGTHRNDEQCLIDRRFSPAHAGNAQMDDADAREMAFNERKVVMVSALVADWSFEQKCTVKNVQDFLRSAPQFLDQLDRFASDRALFFANRLSSSSATQEPKSRSTKSSKAQTEQSDNI
jgi:hypothetical protein